MDYVDENLFEFLLIFIGLIAIYSGLISYIQKGVSSESPVSRFRGISLTLILVSGIIFLFNAENGWITLLGVLLLPVLTSFKQLKTNEILVNKYLPDTFFNLLEENLTKYGYAFEKDVRPDDLAITSKYYTNYDFTHSNEKIKVNWKDSEQSTIQAEFINFQDKDFIKEMVIALREARPPISYLSYNKISLVVAVICLYIGCIRLYGY
ncbi:hypothetical protein [Sutcliffiella rhizosphaerae]|uniref:Uncharacterized protein n=1 Tax=Sutcliffiella rhizosphaerae TaxID=2880967 RepID=A0ABN8AGH8_9BACI|nr:hypothetical protein [Sutcliffiella rhizosphaerae]CAG9622163.1 hypothetical protein BACCIP111883_02954 [Sutcliffiella rhizosphaerae]